MIKKIEQMLVAFYFSNLNSVSLFLKLNCIVFSNINIYKQSIFKAKILLYIRRHEFKRIIQKSIPLAKII